ncbi:hypothetical protein PsAD2_00977 [Pseudovibrio axinellae]|uniref:Bacteriophage phiJL001 Gp84 C-terminal domain-containing protein n=1 Tax=Pseudovibrio axinellae TaxID=989403 RepID=A0A166AF26_9HYPH|nr:DUF2163 domain-containing protein [Pseudovibrio axinellae]KZL20985.1 hypothetical protein PsAD2_00977 [Pseudovibrio axinellae]SEP80122.1 phage conserved hypothetical protein BR0599 [Pseudovibrio axinellae]
MLNAALKEHLDGEGTTVAYCWQLTSPAGRTLGFTTHDHPITFLGITFEPGFGLDATQATVQADFQAGQEETLGFLSSESLSEKDLNAGLWDNAQVQVFLVNWQNPEERELLRRGSLGEVTRDANVFRTEFRSLATRLSQNKGRQLSHQCHADLGDVSCGIDLSNAAYTQTLSITELDAAKRLVVEGERDENSGWWSFGTLTFHSGPYANHPLRIASHTIEQGAHKLSLWSPLVLELTYPLAATLSTGCDKSWGACQEKFQNALNFKGFPHMPGNDFILAGPDTQSAANNGEKLVG